MAKSRAVSVTTTATRLDSVAEDRSEGSTIVVYNNGAATVFIGGADVTTAIGTPIAASGLGPITSLQDAAEVVYGIVAAGSVEVRVFETGVG